MGGSGQRRFLLLSLDGFAHMKSQRLRTLKGGTRVVLILGLLLLLYMLISIPNAATLWADKQWANEQIRGAQDMEQLQRVAHFAASSISIAQQTSTMLLYIFLFATVGMTCFLGWSLLVFRRIEREASSDHAAA